MSAYLEHYLAGEHEQVWDDLVALGERVREEPLHSDALAVARETMRRVRHNLDLVVPRLERLAYAFGAGFFGDMTPAEESEARRQAPVVAPPAPMTYAHFTELESAVGPLPLSLRAFYELVGSVNLVGRFPGGTVGLRPQGIQGSQQRQLPERSKVAGSLDFGSELDPLFVYSLEMALVLFRDWRDRRTASGQSLLPYQLPVSPDCYGKYGTSGGGNYSVEVPCAATDAPLLLEWHKTTFVNYLRICFRCAGFPGLERVAHPPQELLYLTEGLLPI
ncbi:MAG TPA: hypothetical protein VGR57_05165 [Ktedonobacterales bacterium]|nr:hypothetical protein [Ktedonobacterales bacterium]